MKRINALAIDWVTHDEHDGELDKKQEEPKQKRRRSTLRCSSGRSTTISNESTKNRGVSYSSAAEPTLASSSNGAPAEPMLADKGTQEVTNE